MKIYTEIVCFPTDILPPLIIIKGSQFFSYILLKTLKAVLVLCCEYGIAE